MIDFTKIKPPSKDGGPVDPIELFQKLKVTDQGINDLWLAQGDALRGWHEVRECSDVGIVLNTGAGKTLVGLLAAQSLVNETKGKIVYACSSIQLVEQTAEKARGYGLDVTTYVRGSYSNDAFARCVGPCITTYQALFNGMSVFAREELSAVIFDDAHAAEHLLRDHFSLRIAKSSFGALYEATFALFSDYFRNIGKAGSFEETRAGAGDRVLFVPPFETRRARAELNRLFNEANLHSQVETKFDWAHLRDYIDQCCFLLTSGSITVTPPFVPVLTLPYFQGEVRRLYLSATLSAPDAFARTFGRSPDKLIAPTTTAGECERLIGMPSRLDGETDGVASAASLIEQRKALILVPTYRRAEIWQTIAEPPPKETVTEHVAQFKAANGAVKLLLAARYDGVDLPGDTCRVMVVDDLPMGVGPLEKFQWESLGLNNVLRSAIASRIVQSFGRISRGMSDHGVVLLTGKKLLEWVLVPKNASILPAFLQKQLLLGYEISNQCTTVQDIASAMDACLSRNEGWLGTYESFMQGAEAEAQQGDLDSLRTVAEAEAQYAYSMWQGDITNALKALSDSLQTAFNISPYTGAWHSLWLGFAHECLGDLDSAQALYERAHLSQPNIPPVRREAIEGQQISPQVVNIVRQMSTPVGGAVAPPKNMNVQFASLAGGGTSSQTEEALRVLGQMLGLVSCRPDKEHGTGPDVLWHLDGEVAFCIEAKTDKLAESKYNKKEVGQMADHIQWVRNNTVATHIIPIFVGPLVGATDNANPAENVCVVELSQFQELSQRLIAALTDAANASVALTLPHQLHDTIAQRDLIFPEVLSTLDMRSIHDL
ncbi:DEAD/DEAH box helicase family protein [Aliidiomarina indica]|uniref:DEAD/DEAH box helicase family protein n=1 Tax=Aliidiomarina indica TaxID=2749147 RepID=UPI00188F4CDA|nr:DEAD/DEAH box helicase family protein [Aliidiomarina indica]